MNRFDMFAVGAALAVTLLCARNMVAIASFYVELLHLSGATVVVGILGWITATYGPIAIAALFWRWAKLVRRPWVLHLLLLPCAVIMMRTGNSVVLKVIQQPDFDAMMGGPSVPTTMLFLTAVIGYFIALIYGRSLNLPERI